MFCAERIASLSRSRVMRAEVNQSLGREAIAPMMVLCIFCIFVRPPSAAHRSNMKARQHQRDCFLFFVPMLYDYVEVTIQRSMHLRNHIKLQLHNSFPIHIYFLALPCDRVDSPRFLPISASTRQDPPSGWTGEIIICAKISRTFSL